LNKRRPETSGHSGVAAKSTNVRVLLDGRTMTLAQACRKYGLLAETVRQRIERGWPDQDLFNPAEQIVILR
jgi:hypothetical protein